jgi:Cys-tRNA(Pro)/Cys-tRNA(Cys) deacylase
VKTLVFRTPGGGHDLAVLRALDKVDYKSLAHALGVRRKDLRTAEPDALARDLGFEVGGVSPITSHEAAIVLVDLRVNGLETVYCGTGNNRSTLQIAADDLIRIGSLVRIAR